MEMGADASSMTGERWKLIVAASFVQLISGAVYAMGAWQSAARDALGLDTSSISAIGAATFIGSVIAMLGGRAFDALGPRTACALGGTLFATGYALIAGAVALTHVLPPMARVAMPAVGCALAGYSSVSLLDNVVCMTCSLSFPKDRAAIVGYLKAVLASAAGLWALLYVHVFKDGPGLLAYLIFTACAAAAAVFTSLLGLRLLPPGPHRREFDAADARRLGLAIGYTVALALFCVAVSFLYSSGAIHSTAFLGVAGVALGLLPLTLLPCPSAAAATAVAPAAPGAGLQEALLPASEGAGAGAGGAAAAGSVAPEAAKRGKSSKLRAAAAAVVATQVSGVRFHDALRGIDFWLLFLMQFAVFGGGVAANQNLALIFESARDPAAVSTHRSPPRPTPPPPPPHQQQQPSVPRLMPHHPSPPTPLPPPTPHSRSIPHPHSHSAPCPGQRALRASRRCAPARAPTEWPRRRSLCPRLHRLARLCRRRLRQVLPRRLTLWLARRREHPRSDRPTAGQLHDRQLDPGGHICPRVGLRLVLYSHRARRQ